MGVRVIYVYDDAMDVGGGKAPTFGQFVCDINAMDSSV